MVKEVYQSMGTFQAWHRHGLQGEMEALLTGGGMGSAEALMALAAGAQGEDDAPEQEEEVSPPRTCAGARSCAGSITVLC